MPIIHIIIWKFLFPMQILFDQIIDQIPFFETFQKITTILILRNLYLTFLSEVHFH